MANTTLKKAPLFLLPIYMMAISSCKKDEPLPPQPIPAVYYQQSDVAYGSHPRQKADVYLPAGRTQETPTVILIHGGGWTNGDKWEMQPFIDTTWMREENLAIVNMNYRLATATEFKHPAQVNDIGSLIAFLSSKSTEYNISPDRFALVGASAGGHLSMLYDYALDIDNKVKAVVNCVGPTDFVVPEILTDTTQYLSVYGLLGKVHWEDLPLWYSASPYHVCNPQSAPTAIFMGTADPIVPTSQGIKLKDRLDSLSVPAQYTEYTGAGHGWWPSSPQFNDTRLKIRTWLATYLY
jgi:acetyl esterase/lipase